MEEVIQRDARDQRAMVGPDQQAAECRPVVGQPGGQEQQEAARTGQQRRGALRPRHAPGAVPQNEQNGRKPEEGRQARQGGQPERDAQKCDGGDRVRCPSPRQPDELEPDGSPEHHL